MKFQVSLEMLFVRSKHLLHVYHISIIVLNYPKWIINERLYDEDYKTPLYFVGIFSFKCISPFLTIYSGYICKGNTSEAIESHEYWVLQSTKVCRPASQPGEFQEITKWDLV